MEASFLPFQMEHMRRLALRRVAHVLGPWHVLLKVDVEQNPLSKQDRDKIQQWLDDCLEAYAAFEMELFQSYWDEVGTRFPAIKDYVEAQCGDTWLRDKPPLVLALRPYVDRR